MGAAFEEYMMGAIVKVAEDNIRLCKENQERSRRLDEAFIKKFGILKENDMEKKKMTKAEAFEWLKHKKVRVFEKTKEVQEKLFSIGYKWCDGSTEVTTMCSVDFLIIDDDTFQYTHLIEHFKKLAYQEIGADDILSIEIVEGTPKFSYEKVVELAKPLMEYLNDTGCTDQIGVSYYHIVAQPMATFLHGEMKGC